MKSKNLIKLSRLNVGDLFSHRGTIYEIVSKEAWTTKCKYVNESKTRWYMPKYLYCDFSNYTKVEV